MASQIQVIPKGASQVRNVNERFVYFEMLGFWLIMLANEYKVDFQSKKVAIAKMRDLNEEISESLFVDKLRNL